MAKSKNAKNASNASSSSTSTPTSSTNTQAAVAAIAQDVLTAVQPVVEVQSVVVTEPVIESVTVDSVSQLENSTTVSKESNVVENTTTVPSTSVTGGFQGRYENILNRLKVTQSLLREINSDMLLLNREYQRTSRPINKKKTFKKTGDNSRSGITQEVNVSQDLEKFLGLNPGSKISRTSVTRAVTSYIKEHNLQNPSNRRQIILDATLTQLLNPPENEQVTYFNLQKFLKGHYFPTVVAPKTA
jgi:upstream activation factor subunit UAF30